MRKLAGEGIPERERPPCEELRNRRQTVHVTCEPGTACMPMIEVD